MPNFLLSSIDDARVAKLVRRTIMSFLLFDDRHLSIGSIKTHPRLIRRSYYTFYVLLHIEFTLKVQCRLIQGSWKEVNFNFFWNMVGFCQKVQYRLIEWFIKREHRKFFMIDPWDLDEPFRTLSLFFLSGANAYFGANNREWLTIWCEKVHQGLMDLS